MSPNVNTSCLFLFVWLSISLLRPALAQEISCDAILASGIRDYVGKTTELSSRSEFMEGLCSSDQSVQEQTRTRAASGRYGAFGARAGETKSSFDALRKARCESSSSMGDIRLNESDVSNLASASVVNAWLACMQLQKTNRVTMSYDHLTDGFSVGLAHTSVGAPPSVQSYLVSPETAAADVKCRGALSESEESQPIALSSNHKYLNCARVVGAEQPFEVVLRTDIGSYRFSYDGQPPARVQSIEAAELESNIESLQSQIDLLFPSGMVAAFDLDTCPDGWELLESVAGRTIIGAGPKTDLTSERKRGERAGEEVHLLTVDEIPSHNHGNGWLGAGDITPSEVAQAARYPGNLPTRKGSESSSVGGSKAHNNMPPFLVLTYCKRS